jgi:lipoprotein-releasing system ATP-binding protein
MSESEWLLEARGIQKTFKKGRLAIPVLRGVDFRVKKGETVAIVGASGAGKSTLLHILGTLEEPTAGKIYFEGKDIFHGGEEARSRFRNRHVGFVFQFHHLLPEFTALENVMMPGLIAGRHEKFLRDIAVELLTEVGLAHRLHHKPGELSGGESQRVAVARALLMKPELLLGDELTGNLDSENSGHLINLLLELNRKRGVTLVIVTHEVGLARKMSRVVEMRDGKLVS